MKVLVLGAGEQASAIAHRLFRCGFTVVMTETCQPTAVRRAVSFCTAVWEGLATVEGVVGRRWNTRFGFPATLDHVAVVVDPDCDVVRLWRPDVLVDGRLLKRPQVTSVGQAGLVISLGPGAVCGRDAHVVIETNRGNNLGRVIEEGSAEADTGIPGSIAGYSSERVIRAPVAGNVVGLRRIGDLVEAGEQIANVRPFSLVGVVPVTAPIRGVLRGLVHDGVFLLEGGKLGDVDPRGDVQACFTISDKGRTISGGVLEAIIHRFPLVPA